MPVCLCVNCSTELQFDKARTGQTIPCPSCGLDTLLYCHPEPTAARTPGVSSPGDSRPAHHGTGTWDYLVSVRQDTCYKALRAVITFVFGIWAVISILFMVAGPIMWIAGDGNLYEALAGFSAGLISGILCAAGWQASIILIDIADLLIHIGRSKR